jgi:RHS repeat-associated protein
MEPETGLVYLRARWYDPATGRFVQMDSYEGDKTNPASFNKYVSFDDRPMDYTDPTGNISANTIDSVLPEAASGPYRVVMENTFTNLSGGDMFVYTDPIIRDQIKRVAVAQIGNQSWLDEANNKCSKFIYDVLKSIGKAPLKLGGWRGEFYNRGLLKLSSLKYPPLASQWADPSFDIPNWQIVTGGPDEAMPGDIIAESIREYSDASGHVGFVAGYGKTISADSTVNPPGTITESDFGFRRYPSVKAHGLKHNAVVRRFSSNRLFIF